MPYLAADMSRSKHDPTNAFTILEKKLIGEYLTYRYDTALTMTTGTDRRLSRFIRLPLSPDMTEARPIDGFEQPLLL